MWADPPVGVATLTSPFRTVVSFLHASDLPVPPGPRIRMLQSIFSKIITICSNYVNLWIWLSLLYGRGSNSRMAGLGVLYSVIISSMMSLSSLVCGICFSFLYSCNISFPDLNGTIFWLMLAKIFFKNSSSCLKFSGSA